MKILMRSILSHLTACVLLAMSLLPQPLAWGQCGTEVVGRFGGEVGAVVQINISTLAVGRGSTIELVDISNTNLPAWFSPKRTVGIAAPAKKLVHTAGSTRLFAMMEDGGVAVIPLSFSGAVTMGTPVMINSDDAVDLVADGTRVYIATQYESISNGYISSYIDIYETASGTPSLIRWISPFIDDYGFDRIVKIGNTLWAGMHEYESSLLGVEAYDISNPAAPVRVTTSLNNAPLGTFTRVSAMHAIGNKLLVSYLYDTPEQQAEDWMRAVDVSVPTNPVWHTPVDLNGFAGCMTSTGNLLRISIQNSGIGTWDTSNSGALAWLGAYFNTFPQVGQMIAIGAIDYWAAGRAGLMTMLTANPAAISVRANLTPLPTFSAVVRQSGNITCVLDYTYNTLRLYDYTLPEAQQYRGALVLPNYAELIEPGFLAGGVNIVAIATKVPGAGDAIRLVNITNPTAPTLLPGTLGGFEVHRMCVTNSRLYAITTNAEFVIVELSSLSPVLRSTTPFGGSASDYTAITSWEAPGAVNKVVALGTQSFGLWLIDVTSALAPLVSGIYNPVPNYHVRALAKGDHQLYVNSTVGGPPATPYITDIRIEAVTVTTITAPVRRGISGVGFGFGYTPGYDDLTYVSSPSGKFLVGTSDYGDDGVDNFAVIHPLVNFFFFENYFAPVAYVALPHIHGRFAPSATGTHIIGAGDGAGLYQIAMPTSYAPGFALQSFNQLTCYGGTISFAGATLASPTNVTTQWYRRDNNGMETLITNGPTGWGSIITISEDQVFLTIENVHPMDRQFYYYCRATNSCGTTKSYEALVRFCPADFNCSGGPGGTGGITVQDIFDFLAAYFAGDPRADFNGVGGVSIQDIFDFIAAYFAGCF